jgi:hypothetical protein
MSVSVGGAPAREWQRVQAEIERRIDRMWLVEPEEFQRIRWGFIETGAGSGGQVFTVMVHLEAFLMIFGANVIFRLLKIAQYDDVELPALRRMTGEFFLTTFNVFEFMADLGLKSMQDLGEEYLRALADLDSKADYISLTGSLQTYVTRWHRWVHLYFPWNLGVAFPHRDPAELQALAAQFARGAGAG